MNPAPPASPTIPLDWAGMARASQPDPADTRAFTAALVRGDEAAYAQFFERYFDRLLRYLTVATRGDEELARELLQATLVRVSRKMRVCGSEDDLWRWLCAVARNALVDEQRRRQRRVSLWARFHAEPTSEPHTPHERETEAVLLEALHRGLAEFAEADRDLLARKYFASETVREIARELATTEKAVESRLTRLRRKLKETLLRRLHDDT